MDWKLLIIATCEVLLAAILIIAGLTGFVYVIAQLPPYVVGLGFLSTLPLLLIGLVISIRYDILLKNEKRKG